MLERIELAWSRLSLIARQFIAAQITTYRIARNIERPCDLSDAFALSSQDPDFHRFLRHQYEALRFGVPHIGVGHFSIGNPGSVLHRR
jgi:hypothetical protein